MKKNSVLYIHLEEIHNTRSAEIVLPILFNHIKPKSVLDVGCGLGTWLKVCKDLGVEEILGIDGEYVEPSKITIPHDCFLQKDLCELTFSDRKYDLTICLEVAEHLPQKNAQQFVEFLASSSETILFSAAVPYQGGQGHINEQPLSYWLEKFKVLGFTAYDFIRPMIWDNENVDWWYRQNILLYSKRTDLFQNAKQSFHCKVLIHPEIYSYRLSRLKNLINTFNINTKKLDSMDYDISGRKQKILTLIKATLLSIFKP